MCLHMILFNILPPRPLHPALPPPPRLPHHLQVPLLQLLLLIMLYQRQLVGNYIYHHTVRKCKTSITDTAWIQPGILHEGV